MAVACCKSLFNKQGCLTRYQVSSGSQNFSYNLKFKIPFLTQLSVRRLASSLVGKDKPKLSLPNVISDTIRKIQNGG